MKEIDAAAAVDGCDDDVAGDVDDGVVVDGVMMDDGWLDATSWTVALNAFIALDNSSLDFTMRLSLVVFAVAVTVVVCVEGGMTLEGHRVVSYGVKKSSFGPTSTSASGPGVLVTPETETSSLASSFSVVPLLPDSFDLSLASDVLAADPAGVIFLLPPPATPLDSSFIMVRLFCMCVCV